jgi:acetolactate synthase I/II/III large subunit
VMMNLQELQTLRHYDLPIKLFVLNNQGYLSMRLTQQGLFGRLVAEGPATGVSFPDFIRLGQAFDLPSVRLEGSDLDRGLRAVLDRPGPALCEVMLDPEQGFEPKSSSRILEDGRIVSPPLEDMAPFLSREELAENMLPPPKGERPSG